MMINSVRIAIVITAQLLYLFKRVRPDILTAVAFLPIRVTKPQQEDYEKLLRVIQYIRATHDMGVVLEVRGTPTVTAHVDASLGVHPDMKSHTGCLVTLGAGPVEPASSTGAELAGMSDSGNKIIEVGEECEMWLYRWSRHAVSSSEQRHSTA
jgi:hypothetical protein